MKIQVWKPGMTPEEEANVAYFERNMLALAFANLLNTYAYNLMGNKSHHSCGWYHHEIGPGWSRVISINEGRMTFHVPDDFDLGDLPQIEPNWDGHSTEIKWRNVMDVCGVTES